MHSLTFTSWIHPETHFSTTFKTIYIYLHVKQVELAPGSSRTTRNSLISQSCQKYRPTKQILKLFSNGNYFPNCTKLHRYKWTLVKDTSTKHEVVSSSTTGI